MDHNPHLTPWRLPAAADQASRGEIERPAEIANLVWQTRAAPPSAYENQLGDALELAFSAGAETLSALVDKLNQLGLRAPDGAPWTEESFAAEIKRLGA